MGSVGVHDQARRQASLPGRSRPLGQPPLRPQPYAQHRTSTCMRLSAVLVLEEDVDGGGGAAVHVRVPAPGHVFHEAHVAGAKHVPGPITGANLDFAGQMNDQPAFGQGVEVHLSGSVKLLHPDLVDMRQGSQGRVLLQTQFLHMAFPGHWFSMMGMAKCRRLAGKSSSRGYSIIDSIHPEMRSMTWNCYRSSAQRATPLSCNLIRPIPPSIMGTVPFTNVRTVLPTFPRQKRPLAFCRTVDFPIGGFSPPEGRLARGCKPPAFSRFLFQSAVKSAESV